MTEVREYAQVHKHVRMIIVNCHPYGNLGRTTCSPELLDDDAKTGASWMSYSAFSSTGDLSDECEEDMTRLRGCGGESNH